MSMIACLYPAIHFITLSNKKYQIKHMRPIQTIDFNNKLNLIFMQLSRKREEGFPLVSFLYRVFHYKSIYKKIILSYPKKLKVIQIRNGSFIHFEKYWIFYFTCFNDIYVIRHKCTIIF